MGPIHRTKLTLRFHGDDLNPQELSKRLGTEPTSAAARGGTWLTASGEERLAKTGWWQLRMQAVSGEELDDQLYRLFESLTSDQETFRQLAARYNGNLFVGLFLASPNEGLTINPTLAQAIAVRGLELQLDIYGADQDQLAAYYANDDRASE
jgi:hypothetical protein